VIIEGTSSKQDVQTELESFFHDPCWKSIWKLYIYIWFSRG